jgi:hypothetical protein
MLVLYLCVMIVFSLHRESLKLILVDEPLLEVVVSHKAIPSYYTKNKSFASGIFKVWCVCSDFHQRVGGIYRVMGELHRLGRGGNSPSGGRLA